MNIEITESEFNSIESLYLKLKKEPHAPTDPRVITVNAGQSLQKALDESESGQIIVLEKGVKYLGNFILPFKNHTEKVHITSSLVERDDRINPDTDSVSQLVSPNNSPIIQSTPGTSGWAFSDIELVAEHSINNLVNLGSLNQSTVDSEPKRVSFNRIITRPASQVRRAFLAACADFSLLNSYIDSIGQDGTDSQCVLGANCTGRHVIANNFLEATTENILYGGSDSRTPELIPTNIDIFNNTITKRLSWIPETRYRFKNLLELKVGRKVNIHHNSFSNQWNEFAFWFKSVDQDDSVIAPWMIVEEVNFYNNIINNVAGGWALHRNPEGIAQPMNRVNIHANILDIPPASQLKRGNGRGWAALIAGVDDLTFSENKITTDADVTFFFHHSPCARFKLINNEFPDNNYGIKGDSTAEGLPTLDKFAPGYVMTGNKVYTKSPHIYPPNNEYWS